MKRLVFGIILSLLFVSCKNDADTKAIKKNVVKKQNIQPTGNESEIAAEEDFKNDFDILLPRSYRTYENENDASALNEKWMELYEENGQYYIGKANFTIEKDFDECSGDSLLSIIPKNKTLIYINNPELKPGKIEYLKIDKNKIWPKEKLIVTFNKQHYTLEGEGKVLSEFKVSSDDDKQEIFKNVKDYKLYLTTESKAKATLLTQESFNDTFVVLLFAGDIDGDGKLDLIFGANRDYEEERVILFLSSKAKNNEAMQKVAQIAVQFDC